MILSEKVGNSFRANSRFVQRYAKSLEERLDGVLQDGAAAGADVHRVDLDFNRQVAVGG